MICINDCVILQGKWLQSNCDLAEFPESKYWWPSCMRDIFLVFRNVLKTSVLPECWNGVNAQYFSNQIVLRLA